MPVSLSNKLSIKDVDLKGKRVVMRSVPPACVLRNGSKGTDLNDSLPEPSNDVTQQRRL